MFSFGNRKLSTEGYKGVRDFFPDDWALEQYFFDIMRKVATRWGYSEYNASPLEPSELYKEKTSEEIVSNETYTFKDRGGREVTLRPEMTPTVTRMISARAQETPFPARWFSIPNLFRYESPQRGRLREHYQLNVDIFGTDSLDADIEIISLGYDLMKEFGAKDEDFEIRINDRKVLSALARNMGVPEKKHKDFFRLLDKVEKLDRGVFEKELKKLLGEDVAKSVVEKLYLGEAALLELVEKDVVDNFDKVLSSLRSSGINNIVFKPSLTRGFDYYTGTVFEFFDTNKENSRSLFGGGRYDGLAEYFIKEKIPAVGFGMGDVTLKNFLETHGLLPEIEVGPDVYVALAGPIHFDGYNPIVAKLRAVGVSVAVDISGKKLSAQLSTLEKRGARFVLTLGEDELQSGQFTLRNVSTKKEEKGDLETLINTIKK